MSRSSFGFRRSFNYGRKLSRENRKDVPAQQQGQSRSEQNDLHEKRQRSRHDNSDADKATRSIFGDVPLTDTERRYLWAAQSGNLPALEMLVEEAGTFNLSCRDYLGRTALQLAVLGEHYDCIQLLLEKSRLDVIEEGLLHAIKTENVKICDMFLSHPIYSDQRTRMQLEFQHGFYEQEDSSSSFAPDITPIVLAAQCNNFDIVHMLIQKGFTIQTPHNYFCLCTECYNHKNFDRVVHSKSRLNAYRGLASTAYLSLSCDDPIYAAFELSRSLQKLADREKEHKNEYLGLSDKCKNFAVDLLDQCRTNEEVMAALHGGTNTRDLARIKMAIRYEQKKFIAHASCQEHLASMWYAGASWFQHQNFPIKLIMVPFGIVFIPVTAIVYVFLPYSRIGKILKSPFMKFMNYICSYTAFLVLLFLGTQLSSFRSSHLFGGTEGVVNGLIMFYVLGMFWAECKQLWEEGVKGYFSQMWNYMDITMLALYTAGYSTEGVIYAKTDGYISDTVLIHSEDETVLNPQILSKVLFSVANVMSFARIAYILPASETFGQLQISYGRMLQDVGKFIFIYFTVMIAFICGLTSLYSISRNEHFSGLPETTATLFWAAFSMGNAKAPEIDEEQADELNGEIGEPPDPDEITDKELLAVIEVVGYFLYGVYILGAVVVLINMLIAMMSNTFEEIQKSEDSEWKFARAKLWISFIEQGTTLPIPFNIIPTPKSILKLCRWFKECVCCGESKNKSRREDYKQYELEYKAIMHRVVLRFIHKMKFEKKGESLKDEILDTREEVIYQMHSMYGRLAARLELLEKDVFALTKARDGVSSPARSSLSYSRSVPSHPRESANSNPFLSSSDQPRETYIQRRRSYYHERPKRDFILGTPVRTSLQENTRKISADNSPRSPSTPQPSNGDLHDNEANMSDGDKRNRKSSSSQAPGYGGNLSNNSSTMSVNGNSEANRKESVVSAASQAMSDSDLLSLTRRDSYRMRSPLDGSFSPRPGGDRHNRHDSLRGSRKRDGYSSNPRWNQGVIKESSLEDQVSTNGERETSFSGESDPVFRHSGSMTKRREIYNHPNIDAPFGLPSNDPRAHTMNFTEYLETNPPYRRETIQNLVLDMHQMPFSRIEQEHHLRSKSVPYPHTTLPPHTGDNNKGRAYSRSTSPQKEDQQRPSYGPQRQISAESNKHDNNDNNKENNDSDNEDQYAHKLSTVSHQHKSQMYPKMAEKAGSNPQATTHNSGSASQQGEGTESGAQHGRGLEPLQLAQTEASPVKPGRKIGRVHNVFVPEMLGHDSQTDTGSRDPQQQQQQEQKQQRDRTHITSPRSPRDTIFFTNVSHEGPGHPQPLGYLSSEDKAVELPTVDVRDFLNRPIYNVHGTSPPRDHASPIARLPLEHSVFPVPRPITFNIDQSLHGDESLSTKPYSADRNLSTGSDTSAPSSLGYLNPHLAMPEEDLYPEGPQHTSAATDQRTDNSSSRHYRERSRSPNQRPSPLRKRESFPVIALNSKHQRVLHMGRDTRPRFSMPSSVIPDPYPLFTSSSGRFHQHHPINVDTAILADDIDLATQEYDAIQTPFVIPRMATNLQPFPAPIQSNDIFVKRQSPQATSNSDSDHGGGASDGNEKATPRRRSPRTKKTSIVSLVRGRLSDKVKGKEAGIKHNRSLSLNRFGGARSDRLKTLHPQRSKEV